jgi:hypothetical protein
MARQLRWRPAHPARGDANDPSHNRRFVPITEAIGRATGRRQVSLTIERVDGPIPGLGDSRAKSSGPGARRPRNIPTIRSIRAPEGFLRILRDVFVVTSGEFLRDPLPQERLATDIAGNQFGGYTANHELLRIPAGIPLTVTDVSNVTTLSSLSSTIQRDQALMMIATLASF